VDYHAENADGMARRVAPDLQALLAVGPEVVRRLRALDVLDETPADLATIDPVVDDY
jgi:hypothetical protein